MPRFRAVAPSPWQLAADPDTPYRLWLATDREALQVATNSLGMGIDVRGEVTRVSASRRELARLAQALAERGSGLARDLERYLSPVTTWRLRSRVLPLDRGWIVGILNLTEDSFSGDGVGCSVDAALRRAGELRMAGADIIDVGAETARADRPALDPEQEAAIVGPVVAALTREGHCVSSDTYKPVVAHAALESGAEIVNDISGLTMGTGAATEAARAGAGYVLNYSYSVPKRRPETPPVYEDVMTELVAWMEERVSELRAAGLGDEQIAIDPGIAFGKSHDEDIQVIRRLGELRSAGLPVMLAHSRKNFIGSITGRPPGERDLETHVVSAFAYEQGVRIFRVHDVEGTRRALGIAEAFASRGPGAFAPGGGSWPWRAGAETAHMARGAADKPAPRGQRW
ncbi:MAG: dihydropteroate synthase [Dehalococcoidia bacterium]|nr:dihydropteroate synthase [Dehalococcoidia bacterium]